MPEVMIPLVSTAKELELCRSYVVEAAEETMTRFGCSIEYKVGTMIELPRAALQAKSIARQAEFFSFGTNDLTQMTYGFSRDDMGKFLPFYLQEGILIENPLSTFDIEGVGELVKIGTERGRHANARLKVGVVENTVGIQMVSTFPQDRIDYVSCSPFRVPVARLAAQAQVARKEIDAVVVTGMYDFKAPSKPWGLCSYPPEGYDYGTIEIGARILEPQTWHFEKQMMVHGTCSLAMPIPTSILPMVHCSVLRGTLSI